MQESRMPDFSVPGLSSSSADLTMPGFDAPDVMESDPSIPDLTQPDQPDGLDLMRVSPDLFASDHSLDVVLPQVEVNDPPGELDSDAIELATSSPDNSHLPPHLAYENLETMAGLSHRDRHLGMLLLGLEGKMEGMEKSDAPHPY